MLLLTAFIWGTSCVSQSVGMEVVEGFTFNGIRTLLGAFALLPFILIRDHIANKTMSDAQIQNQKKIDRKTLVSGTILGVILCVASNFQQFAFNYSTSGKIAFVTAMYMFFVPLFGLFLKKRIPLITWFSVGAGFVGLYLLCINPDQISAINKGDGLAFICAILFAVHILFVEKLAPGVDGAKLSCIQFFVSGMISCILMFLFEHPEIAAIRKILCPLLYSGVLSCGLAYTLQIIGQKYTEATVASLLMCMESVFAVLAGAVFLHELLSVREAIGCIIMFMAIIISQLSEVFDSTKRKREKLQLNEE